MSKHRIFRYVCEVEFQENVLLTLFNMHFILMSNFLCLIRRKHFIEKALELMQNKITDGAFKGLVDDMENIRYPKMFK